MKTTCIAHHFIPPLCLTLNISLFLLLGFSQSVAAADTNKTSCALSEQGQWSDAEYWVWDKILSGASADLTTFRREHPAQKKTAKPELESRPPTQQLSAQFIETLLLEKNCQNQIPRRGVHISGAWFWESLDLSHAALLHPLSLVKSRFDQEFIMDGLKSTSTLRLSGSIFHGILRLSNSVWEGNLFLDGINSFDELNLDNAKISGQFDMSNSHIAAPVDMDSITIGDSLFMQFSSFEEAVDITYASIGKVLVLPGAYKDVIDLSDTRIGNELRLSRNIGSPLADNEDAMLILRSTKVGALQDRHGSWPAEIELDGFTYERLGGYVDESGGEEISLRSVAWFVDEWLAKDESYTAQPYKQLAAVLKRAGLESTAGEILYASKERERQAAGGLRWLGLSVLNYTMGYGYRYSYTLYCVIALVMIGAFLLKSSGEGERYKMPYGIAYSLDMLLPVVQLRKYHYDVVDLKSPLRYYFYFHVLMGYVLASFLIAGLSGLTK